ncbi:hypothetical protein RHMOL_Rhmol01G0114500 [Rhododendron molle]|uniref:Uncharacterized protein n=1 Tax=Rhododendron molle TaxID=49168 RepID=A0ACC0Q1P8_RHOML|nr:hypothetical protein RHMOL_Rhmol01G0114500 [Rhododendron molle]
MGRRVLLPQPFSSTLDVFHFREREREALKTKRVFSHLRSSPATLRLGDSKNVVLDEKVAIFLWILSHHMKNRRTKFVFWRSGETISEHFNVVLRVVLRLHNFLLQRPEPVPANHDDDRWNWFQVLVHFVHMNNQINHFQVKSIITTLGTMSTNINVETARNDNTRTYNPLKHGYQEMAVGGAAPPRGSAAAAAANLRRRRTAGGGTAAGGAAGNMLQFYTDDAPGLKISPNVVLVMSIGFIAFVAILHVMGKLYFVHREA